MLNLVLEKIAPVKPKTASGVVTLDLPVCRGFAANEPRWHRGCEGFNYDVASVQLLPGQYFDEETSLHYNWHRYYDPSIGAYTTPDMVGLLRDYSDPQFKVALDLGVIKETGLNGKPFNHLYSYAIQNPLSYYDESGLGPNRYITGIQIITISIFTGVHDIKAPGSVPRPDFNPSPITRPVSTSNSPRRCK